MNEATLNYGAPWHKESYGRFVNESLPQLLAKRMPLAGYEVHPRDDYTCSVLVTVKDVAVTYDLPQPDENGIFEVDGRLFTVVPLASGEHLDSAEIKCVGEQLYDHIERRLGEAASDLPWDEALVRAWLPLDIWVREVVTSSLVDPSARWTTGQLVDTTNGMSKRTHLRRIVIPEIEKVVTASQFGRVCPFEVPEGPNIGHVFSLALGATIQNGRIEIIDNSPEAGLGLTASMVPFLEHSDANRLTFGVNTMRQWMVPPDPEPALVQTGYEPDEPGIWCGRNLLTAFVSYGADTYEDAILVSESCARRLNYPNPIQPGDRLSNRHGTKGVISTVLPDDEMPHLPDGTPVELVFSFIGLHTRLNFGQIREAVMGRIARAEGGPVVVQPFSAPPADELRKRMKESGLPEDGMEFLTIRRGGKRMKRPGTVGWVYWGKSYQTSSEKMRARVTNPGCMRQGWMEYYNLRDMGCFETVKSYFNTCSADRSDAEAFVREIEKGPVEQSEPPTPKFLNLQRRLSAAGIQAELGESGLSLKLSPHIGEMLELAVPVQHPWLRGHTITRLGVIPEVPEYRVLEKANAKLERIISSKAPASLERNAQADLENSVRSYLDALVTPDDLRMGNQVMFSAKAVLAPGTGLRLDQVGISDEIAWTLFGPLVVRELEKKEPVEKRNSEAAKVLDDLMARSCVIVNRAPTIIPTALMAFHPVRSPDPVIRLHPLVCFLMNADFDGDQAAVILPVTESAQRELGEKLSFAGHLSRDPNLYDLRFLTHEALWGLAELSVQQGGPDELRKLVGLPVILAGGIADRDTIAEALGKLLKRDGVDAVLGAMQKLMDRGLQIAMESGASMSPFIGSGLALPPAPDGTDQERWKAYDEEVHDLLLSRTDYSSPDLDPQLLALKSGARGTARHLRTLVAARGLVADAKGDLVPVKHSKRDGLTPEEVFACVAGAREGLAGIEHEITQSAYGIRAARGPKGFGVLARAMRASLPGPVLARAAAAGEIDPLTDLDSRLFVGLDPLE